MRFLRHRTEEAPPATVRLIVGLGNPGTRYQGTRHNIGFMSLEHLAVRHNLSFRASRQRAEIARGEVGNHPVLLALPVTFMNDSGIAVRRLMEYYRVPRHHLLVLCDDMDLPFGTIRIRPSGSAGGQRGLQSIIDNVHGQDFPRLRLGVGRPRGEAISHVLGRFPPDQERLLPRLLDVSADAVEAILGVGVEAAMNRFNRDWSQAMVE